MNPSGIGPEARDVFLITIARIPVHAASPFVWRQRAFFDYTLPPSQVRCGSGGDF